MLSDAVKSQLDILDYARDIGYTPYRVSSRYYSIKEMDSIRINVEKGLWFRNSLVGVRNDVNARGQIGGSVIDFAAYFAPERYMPDGVRSKTVGGAAMIGLAEKYGIVDDGHYRVFNTSNRYQQSRPRPEPNPSFTKKNEIAEAKTGIYDVPRDLSGEDKVKDYLTRVRGVSENIVQRFIDEDMLYQSMPNHGFSNCVFVSPDNSFGCVHGASETARYVRTLSGSDMNELFFYSPDKADDSSKEKTLVITESIIDAMSVMTQFEREGRSLDDYKFLALAGVTNIGTRDAPKSLAYHLNKPENGNIKKVMLALDNDEAGLRGIDIARDILLSDFHYQPQDVITYLPPKGKDWNDYIKLNEPVQPEQEQTISEQETAEPSPVIPDVDIVLHIEGDYDTIKTIRDEFEPLNEEWMGGFASYIHPYSTPENTLMTCEIFDDEHNADELTAIAEKYDVTITRITREDLAAIYTEEYMRELEENSIREISDNPMGIEQTGIASASEQSVQEQSHRETGAEPTQQENTPVEVQETAQLEQEQSVTEQESAEPSPTQEQAVTEQEEHKPFKGYIYISATDFQGDLQETSFLINEGVTSEEVLNIIDYNTGYFEEVRRALRVVGTEFSFNDEENDHPSNGQLEYDNILDEGRITFEIEISDLDSGDYRFTSYNNEKGGIPYGELDLHKNYEITNGTLSYDNALATAYDLQVGDIVSFRSHECTVTDVDMNAIQFTDNSSGKVYTVRSNARGYKGKGWEDILDSGSTLYNYAVIARAGDSYANRRLENVSAQEISHNETEAEPTQQENTPVEVQETAEPIQEQSDSEQEYAQSEFVIEGTLLLKYNGNAEHVVVPDGVTVIGSDAFFGNEQITSVILPDDVNIIDFSAFEGCKNLKSVTIPDSVYYVGTRAFADCENLVSVNVPESVDDILLGTFQNCTSLEAVTIPDGVTRIGYGAFMGCTSLTSASIPESVDDIGSSAFFGCSSLESVVIPESVKRIDDAAFMGCTSLTSVTIPESVIEIGAGAFDDCINLESVSLPNLDNLALPESINLSEYAFGNTPYFRNQQMQEQSHRETVIAEPTQQENIPVEVQETAEPSPAQEQENAQPEQEQDVGEADIVATNIAIYSDEELSAMRDSADLTLVDIDYRDKDISANDRMKVALENGLKKILDTEGFKNWLTTRSTDTQKSLSVGNSLRIFAQNPTAHYTASYERWLDFGRQVAKGAQSMAILCPKMPNEAKMVEKANEVYFKLQEQVKKGVEKPTVELYPNSPVKFTMNDKGTMDVSINDKSIKMLPDRHSLELFIKKRLSEHPETYTIGHHFDVKDTIIPDTLWVRKDSGDYKESEIVKDKDGNPNVRKIKGVEKIEIINTPERQARFQPSLGITIEPHDKDKMQRLYEICVALSKNNGVPVIESTKAEDKNLIGASGYYSAMTSDDCPKGFIVLNADMEISEKCSVLLHEIAHSELHFEPLKLREEMGISRLDTAMKEVQAEAVAYSVAHNFGLETDTASFKYLAAFTSGFDMRQLTTSMDVIVRETEKLTKDLTKILDEKGYNLDLSVKENTVNVQELSQEAMNIVTVANDKCTSAMQELPKMMNEYQRDAEIVSTLREQYSAYSTQLGYITNAYDLVDNLNKASTNADKEAIATQLKEILTSISISQETCKALDSKFVEQADKVKGQLRVSFEKDSISTLKDMAKSYPSLNLLSDMQLKYIAESKYISANYGRLLKTNPQLFVEKAVERAQQLPLIAGKNGAFVEIVKCEQFTSRPFFENGTLCSPAVANSIFAAAEEKCSEIITQAEEHKESFPTTRCDFCVYAPVDGDLKAYITHIEIGSGEQRNLYDNINQFCELPFKEDLLSACQERPLARSIYVPSVEQTNGEAEQNRGESNKKENMGIDEVAKTFTERSEQVKAEKSQQRNAEGKENPNNPSREQ